MDKNLEELWENSEVCKRITGVENYAQIHSYPPWQGQTIQEWITKHTVPKSTLEELVKELEGRKSKDIYWTEGNTTNPRMLEIVKNQGFNQALDQAILLIKAKLE